MVGRRNPAWPGFFERVRDETQGMLTLPSGDGSSVFKSGETIALVHAQKKMQCAISPVCDHEPEESQMSRFDLKDSESFLIESGRHGHGQQKSDDRTAVRGITWEQSNGLIINFDGVDLKNHHRSKRTFALLASLFVIFLFSASGHAYLSEHHYVELKLARDASWFVSGLLYATQGVFACIHLTWSHGSLRKTTVPFSHIVTLGALGVVSQGFSAVSLRYVNYPTNVIFKSCKLIPVMIGSVVLLRAKFCFLDVLGSLLMCVGVAEFVLAGKSDTPNFSLLGIVALTLSIAADGMLGNVQKRIFWTYPSSSPEELTVGTTFCGAGMIFAFLIITNDFFPSLAAVQSRGALVWLALIAQGFLGFINTIVVMMMVQEFDPLTATTLSTMKRVVAITTSFFFFSKPFVFQYLWSGAFVAFGLYANVFVKLRRENTSTNVNPV